MDAILLASLQNLIISPSWVHLHLSIRPPIRLRLKRNSHNFFCLTPNIEGN